MIGQEHRARDANHDAQNRAGDVQQQGKAQHTLKLGHPPLDKGGGAIVQNGLPGLELHHLAKKLGEGLDQDEDAKFGDAQGPGRNCNCD